MTKMQILATIAAVDREDLCLRVQPLKNSLLKYIVIVPAIKTVLLKIILPKFVWLCEMCREKMEHCDDIISGFPLATGISYL